MEIFVAPYLNMDAQQTPFFYPNSCHLSFAYVKREKQTK